MALKPKTTTRRAHVRVKRVVVDDDTKGILVTPVKETRVKKKVRKG
jgi:hypothetical protein